MKTVLFFGLACAALATAAGCSAPVQTSAVATTSASVATPVVRASRSTGTAKDGTRVATTRRESSLRTRAAEKSRCESGDDSACLVAGSFER
jgi:hypothetical protein